MLYALKLDLIDFLVLKNLFEIFVYSWAADIGIFSN